jgi:hypothetical protein
MRRFKWIWIWVYVMQVKKGFQNSGFLSALITCQQKDTSILNTDFFEISQLRIRNWIYQDSSQKFSFKYRISKLPFKRVIIKNYYWTIYEEQKLVLKLNCFNLRTTHDASTPENLILASKSLTSSFDTPLKIWVQ